MNRQPIVIVGSGIAADSALRAIRALDDEVRVAMITEDPEPAYSACVFAEYLAGDLSRPEIFFRSPEEYEQLGVDLVVNTRVEHLDLAGRTVKAGDQDLPYSRLIVATGSEPLRPPVPGCDLPGNFTLKFLQDADALHRCAAVRYVVVGSGPIGVEVSAALAERGCRVTLVEQLSSVLPKVLDARTAAFVRDDLERVGVDVRTSATVTAVHGTQQVEAVSLDDDDRLICDAIIWAVGMRPRVDLARRSGLAIGDSGGIRTDRHMRTSDPHVFACGDCVESPDVLSGEPGLNLLWPNAAHQGEVAGANAVGAQKAYRGDLFQMVVELPGVTVGTVGTTGEPGTTEVRILDWGERGGYHLLILDQEGTLIGAQSVNNLRYLGPLQNLIRQRMGLDGLRARIDEVPKLQQAATWTRMVSQLVQYG